LINAERSHKDIDADPDSGGQRKCVVQCIQGYNSLYSTTLLRVDHLVQQLDTIDGIGVDVCWTCFVNELRAVGAWYVSLDTCSLVFHRNCIAASCYAKSTQLSWTTEWPTVRVRLRDCFHYRAVPFCCATFCSF